MKYPSDLDSASSMGETVAASTETLVVGAHFDSILGGAAAHYNSTGTSMVLAAAIQRQIERAEAVKRLVGDNAALDAKIVTRAIELREIRDQLRAAETERRRLAAIVESRAA